MSCNDVLRVSLSVPTSDISNKKGFINSKNNSISYVRSLGIYHSLAVVNESLDFTLKVISIYLSCPLQPAPFDLIFFVKVPLAEVGFQPLEQKSVAWVCVRTVGTLEDSRYFPAARKVHHSLSFVRTRIVPHSRNLNVDAVRAETAPEVSSAPNKRDDSLGIHSLSLRYGSEAAVFVWGKGYHQHHLVCKLLPACYRSSPTPVERRSGGCV